MDILKKPQITKEFQSLINELNRINLDQTSKSRPNTNATNRTLSKTGIHNDNPTEFSCMSQSF